jgi:hypothetical protein
VFQLPKVKVEELVTFRGIGLRSTRLQLLESPDNRVETSGGRRMGAGALTSSPSVVMMKSRLLKRTCTPGV